MFSGLASPTHLIVVLSLILLLFGARRIPALAKGLGTGIKELREGFSTGPKPEARRPEERRPGAKPAPGRWANRPARVPARKVSKPRVRHRHAGDGDRRAPLLGHLRSQQAPRHGPRPWPVRERSPPLGGRVQGGSRLRRGGRPGASQRPGSGSKSGTRG